MNVERFNHDAAELVVRLACLTEERTRDEQRALLSLAWAIDRSRMKQTVTNSAPRTSNLVEHVLQSVDVGCDGASIELSKAEQMTRHRMLEACTS